MNPSKTKDLRTFARQVATEVQPEEMERISGGDGGDTSTAFCVEAQNGGSLCFVNGGICTDESPF